jgi:YHS domain-containing protein
LIRLLVFVVELVFWLLVIRLVLRAFARLTGAASGAPRAAAGPRPSPLAAPEDLVLDRVCHTHVPRSRALRATVSGREEYFCSAACRDKALAAVERAS